jgi:hypothetical protein
VSRPQRQQGPPLARSQNSAPGVAPECIERTLRNSWIIEAYHCLGERPSPSRWQASGLAYRWGNAGPPSGNAGGASWGGFTPEPAPELTPELTPGPAPRGARNDSVVRLEFSSICVVGRSSSLRLGWPGATHLHRLASRAGGSRTSAEVEARQPTAAIRRNECAE